jgi:hypothetical protein
MMINPLDPGQLTADRELPPARREADLAMLRSQGDRPPVSRRLLLTLGGLALTSSLAAAGVIVTQSQEPTNTQVFQCHATLDVGRGADYAGGDTAFGQSVNELTGEKVGPPPPTDPIVACGNLWRDGVLRAGTDETFQPDGKEHAVPALVACVTDKGVSAVFPSNSPSVCDSLGLKRLAR